MRWIYMGGHKKRQKERLRKTKSIRFRDPRDRRHSIPHGTRWGGGQGDQEDRSKGKI